MIVGKATLGTDQRRVFACSRFSHTETPNHVPASSPQLRYHRVEHPSEAGTDKELNIGNLLLDVTIPQPTCLSWLSYKQSYYHFRSYLKTPSTQRTVSLG
jgi:hypothetical protein